VTREQLANVFSSMGATIPDLAWEVVDIRVLGEMIIARGEATGTTCSRSVTADWQRAITLKIG